MTTIPPTIPAPAAEEATVKLKDARTLERNELTGIITILESLAHLADARAKRFKRYLAGEDADELAMSRHLIQGTCGVVAAHAASLTTRTHLTLEARAVIEALGPLLKPSPLLTADYASLELRAAAELMAKDDEK